MWNPFRHQCEMEPIAVQHEVREQPLPSLLPFSSPQASRVTHMLVKCCKLYKGKPCTTIGTHTLSGHWTLEQLKGEVLQVTKSDVENLLKGQS